MAYITLDSQKLAQNFTYLETSFKRHHIEWAVVSKLLCGTEVYLKELLKHNVNQLCDSRVTNLKRIKQLKPEVETIYIKPPAPKAIKGVVTYADISLNTEIETIKLLNLEAQAQQKIHKVIIMIELGELREGVLGDDLVDFYEQVFDYSHIEVIGIGTNLTCMNGILPNHDKLIQLSLYKQLIEAKFNRKIPYVSGGSSVTIPLIPMGLLPKGINHFRVGESLFFGTSPYDNKPLDGMETDLFEFHAEIIELNEKPYTPMGEMGLNVEGEMVVIDENRLGEKGFRAIIDVGKLDVEDNNLIFNDIDLSFLGGSSDMMVVDLHDNPKSYSVGDTMSFKLNYMGVLRLMNSKYIETKLKDTVPSRA